MEKVKIAVPGKAAYIINRITEAGFEAYVVGGCVRDSVLGRVPQDWDITTSARPEQVKALFQRTIDTGIEHGTVTVMVEGEGFEVTTYRIDGEYEDSRHPKEVIFTPSLREDLRRRDFTINAMAYNEEQGLIDIFGGMEDIERGIIRCVGDPMERFREDALRILRALRFSAQLGYRIEDGTREAIRALAPTLRNISAERIATELVKTVNSPHPDYLRDAYEMGVTAVFLPEFDACMKTPQVHKHHMYNVGEHILHSMLYIPADKVLRLTMLFHDMGKAETVTYDEDGTTHFYGHPAAGKEIAGRIMKRLKFDNDTMKKVCRLVEYHDYGIYVDPDMKIVRRAINRIGEDAFPALFRVRFADMSAQSEYKREEKTENLRRWRFFYDQVIAESQCVSLKTLAVSGKDLMEAGVPQGPKLGECLNALLELVIEEPELNKKEILLEKLKTIL